MKIPELPIGSAEIADDHLARTLSELLNSKLEISFQEKVPLDPVHQHKTRFTSLDKWKKFARSFIAIFKSLNAFMEGCVGAGILFS